MDDIKFYDKEDVKSIRRNVYAKFDNFLLKVAVGMPELSDEANSLRYIIKDMLEVARHCDDLVRYQNMKQDGFQRYRYITSVDLHRFYKKIFPTMTPSPSE
ncbi:MAG: hypothetical protein IJ542_02645 [Clostridia bacterium]|nr:hypothetical protein [Clostridia bacterium]